MTARPRVAVCAITYKRPIGLRRLLEGLNALTFRAAEPVLRCIIVDNDPEGSARATVEAIRAEFRWGLEFAVEPRRGIPFARNAALRTAMPDAEWIAFIDDDEQPRPDWLDELLRVAAAYEADVVTGPVEPRFESAVPDWVVKGAFFARAVRPSGCRLDRSATNNVVFRAEILKGMRPWFDERMALTGGSDIRFFRRMHRRGHRIVWADDAIVYEWVPSSRTTAKWIYQRAFRYGTTTSLTERVLRPAVQSVPLILALAAYKLLKGAVFLVPATCFRGRAGVVKYIRLMCYGAGMLNGLVGRTYEEYRTTHGT